MRKILNILLFLAFFVAEGAPLVVKGHLGKDQVEKLRITAASEAGDPLILVINSESGDVQAVLGFAKELYERQKKGAKIVVFIDDNAVGPAAILPFLADELYTTVFVTWGDILLNSDRGMQANVLKSQVASLVRKENLLEMAEKMVGENALVASHRTLKDYGAIAGEMSLKEFNEKFGITEPVAQAIDETPLDARLRENIHFSKEGENLIGRIVIDDRTSGINEGTWLYVKSALDAYKKKKPIFIILELNTPGGQVFSSQKISDALKEMDTQYGIPVVAYINNWAISAGAMLAYSSRFIAIAKDASMGAAEPVFQTQEGMQTASEKVNSALRADFANRAAFFGRSPAIAEAMVDKEIILVRRGDKFVALSAEKEVRSSDTVISPKGKLLTLNAKELMEYGVADWVVEPVKVSEISASEKEKGSWPAAKEKLFQQPFMKGIPNAVVDTFEPDWKMKFFALLAHPMVASLLFMGMLIGFYIEINTPGFGVPGSIALACLAMMVLSSFALEAVNWLEIIMVGLGLLLLLLDIFFIPTFGIVGTAGALLFLGGLFAIMLPGLENVNYEFDTGTFNAAGEYVVRRLAWLSGGFLAGLAVIGLLAKYVFPSFSPFRKFVLSGGEQEGYVAAPAFKIEKGTKGIAATDLRPFGKIEIDGTLYEATTESDWVDRGSEVVVVETEGNILRVEKK